MTSIIPIALGTYAHSYLRDKNIMRDYGHMSFSEFDYDGIPTPGYASNEMSMGPGRIMSALDPRDYNYNEYLKQSTEIGFRISLKPIFFFLTEFWRVVVNMPRIGESGVRLATANQEHGVVI